MKTSTRKTCIHLRVGDLVSFLSFRALGSLVSDATRKALRGHIGVIRVIRPASTTYRNLREIGVEFPGWTDGHTLEGHLDGPSGYWFYTKELTFGRRPKGATRAATRRSR